jgi:hypothetical protein
LYSNVVHSFHHITYQYLFLTLILIGSTSGKLESNITCRFSEQNQTEFWTGKFISGDIEFNNFGQQQFKFKRINIELIGNVVYKTILEGPWYDTLTLKILYLNSGQKIEWQDLTRVVPLIRSGGKSRF